MGIRSTDWTLVYFKLQIGGHIGEGEIFTVNIAYDTEGELDENWIQATANDMVAAAAAVTPDSGLLTRLRLTDGIDSYRLEGRRDADDSLIGVAVADADYAGTSVSGTDTHPPQCAAVISFRTDNPGASGRGRIYWPLIAADLDANLRLSSNTAGQIAVGAATWFSAIETAMEDAASTLPPWATLVLSVRSKTTKTTPHVQRIQVGNVVDTQRRRRDALPEAYTTQAYPPA